MLPTGHLLNNSAYEMGGDTQNVSHETRNMRGV